MDDNKKIIEEDEFLYIINNDHLRKSSISLGDYIKLDNPYCSFFQVIGIDHDGVKNSVDLLANTQVNNQVFSNDNNLYHLYPDSSIRKWINEDFLYSFINTNIIDKAKTMRVITNISNSSIKATNDKVKLLSMTELGATHQYAPINEGSLYSGIFTISSRGMHDLSRWRKPGKYGNPYSYWLRSSFMYNDAYLWIVSYNGMCTNCRYDDKITKCGILPVLRF